MPNRPLLSIVAPAYNEEDVLPAFHAELTKVLHELRDEFDIEIVYVDDGSDDATPVILTRLALADPRVHYLRLSRNFGHQAALTAGLEYARGDLVISMDSDLQHPPAVIPELLAEWRKGHDVVLDHSPERQVARHIQKADVAAVLRGHALLQRHGCPAGGRRFSLADASSD